MIRLHEEANMIIQLRKYLTLDQPIEMIYLDRYGKTSKRTVRFLELKADRIKAYCFCRRAPRVFSLENILAVQPVVKKSHA